LKENGDGFKETYCKLSLMEIWIKIVDREKRYFQNVTDYNDLSLTVTAALHILNLESGIRIE
jgi:hypothetical protein